MRRFITAALLAVSALAGWGAEEPGTFFTPPDAARYSRAAPYSSAAEVSRRLGISLPVGPYTIGREGFRVIAPPSVSTNSGWGLFVWISPGHDAYIPREWEPVFAKHKLVFVAPYQAGNGREVMDRSRLALDAVHNLTQEYGLDPRRVYIGGFSGGGRMASMLAVGYADLFAGVFCVCGVNFYQDVSFSSEDAGMGGASLGRPGQVTSSPTVRFAGAFRPPWAMQDLAKRELRVYLLTGSTDQNRLNTKALYEAGFKRAGYRAAQYREVRGLGHAMPSADELEKALAHLLR